MEYELGEIEDASGKLFSATVRSPGIFQRDADGALSANPEQARELTQDQSYLLEMPAGARAISVGDGFIVRNLVRLPCGATLRFDQWEIHLNRTIGDGETERTVREAHHEVMLFDPVPDGVAALDAGGDGVIDLAGRGFSAIPGPLPETQGLARFQHKVECVVGAIRFEFCFFHSVVMPAGTVGRRVGPRILARLPTGEPVVIKDLDDATRRRTLDAMFGEIGNAIPDEARETWGTSVPGFLNAYDAALAAIGPFVAMTWARPDLAAWEALRDAAA